MSWREAIRSTRKLTVTTFLLPTQHGLLAENTRDLTRSIACREIGTRSYKVATDKEISI